MLKWHYKRAQTGESGRSDDRLADAARLRVDAECGVDRFAGSLDEWESALDGLASSLADLADCRIPLGMLYAAVTYSKTGDEKKLLSLPLEQRLLQEVLPPPGPSDRASC